MNSPEEISYPWYKTIHGDEIEQGDIFESCPIFLPHLI